MCNSEMAFDRLLEVGVFGKKRRRRRAAEQATPAAGAELPIGRVPPQAQAALDRIPPQFRDALGDAPPEVLEALSAFGDGAPVQVNVAEPTTLDLRGVDLSKVDLTGTPAEGVDLAGLVEQVRSGELPPGQYQVQGVDVGAPVSFSSTSVEATGAGPDHDLEVQFDRDEYSPGETVTGTVVARRRVKAKQLNVALGYCDHSDRYLAHQLVQEQEGLHRGNLEAGTAVRFSLTIPPDALPNWDPAGTAAARARGGRMSSLRSGARPDLARFGGAYWGVVTTATRGGMVGHDIEYHPIPLVDDPARWVGPPVGELPEEPSENAKGWDVSVVVPERAPRRGQAIDVTLTTGAPDPGGRAIEVGLLGEVHFDIETTSSGSGTGTTRSRSTQIAMVHEEWQTVDGRSPVHQVRFVVPTAVPFSYGKARAAKVGPFTYSRSTGAGRRDRNAFAVQWRLVAREQRRARRDPTIVVGLVVRP